MFEIRLDEKTKTFIEDILKHKSDFEYLKNEIKKELTADQQAKLEQEFKQAFEDIEKIYNVYK